MENEIKKVENRIRSKDIHIRVTDSEYQALQERMKEAGKITMQGFLLEAGINGYLIKVDYTELKNLTQEINKIGVNINQIAHKINTENMIYETEMNDLQDKINLIWKLVRSKFFR